MFNVKRLSGRIGKSGVGALVVIAFVVAGLWVTSVPVLGQANPYKPSGITGNSVNMQETSTLAANSRERRNSNSVAALTRTTAGNRFCTGFLIALDLIMTNAHCFSAEENPSAFTFDPTRVPGTRAVFNFVAGTTPIRRETYDCGTLVAFDPVLDVAIIACSRGPIGTTTNRFPGQRWGVVRLTDADTAQGQGIYVIHQNCVDSNTAPFTNNSCTPFKKISRGAALAGPLIDVPFSFRHSADTMPGSSGAPVFSATTHLVIGLHKCCTDRSTGNAPDAGNLATKSKDLANILMSMPIPNRSGNLPDLQIQSLFIDPLANVQAVVLNAGTARANNFQVKCYLLGVEVVTRTVQRLNANSARTLRFRALIDRCVVDPRSLGSPSGSVFESRENNNERDALLVPGPLREELALQPAAQPLQIQDVGVLTIGSSALEFYALGQGIAGLTLRLFDLNGRQILAQEAAGTHALVQLGQPLANGVYFYTVVVRAKNGEVKTSQLHKLVIQR
jgi:hypothetical protein